MYFTPFATIEDLQMLPFFQEVIRHRREEDLRSKSSISQEMSSDIEEKKIYKVDLRLIPGCHQTSKRRRFTK
jgi:hypothetical protein